MNWKIEKMQSQLSDGLVIKINYRVIANDKELIADKRGVVSLTGDPSSPDFIGYQDLKEIDVVAWVKSEVDVAAIEAEVQSILDAKIAARSTLGKPLVDYHGAVK
jgi:hypothetical protein